MFRSTRGTELISSKEAILKGLADDGGLFVIDKINKVDYHDLLDLDYCSMAAKIIHSFFSDDFSYDEIYKEVSEAYSSFDTKNVVELKKTNDCYFLELFHGPTLAFKDLALVVLPRLMSLSKKKLNDNTKTTILTATSGDTGGAALNGFKNIDNINIAVLYPNNGVSVIQEAQMTSFRSPSAKVIAINGNFDDCQSFVKKFFKENTDLNLSSANSINIARLVPQIVYYYYSYIYLLKNKEIADGDKINFSVPTGNFGDIFAGFYAKEMGLPINKLICASNQNKVLTDFFNKGIYDKNRKFFKTNSPSMDILISSNLERLLFYANNSDSLATKKLMDELNNNGKYEFKNPFDIFYADYCLEDETLSSIKKMYKNEKYIIDPHTAVAYNVYSKYALVTADKTKTVVISTASPFKFPNSVLLALGQRVPFDQFAMIENLSIYGNISVPKVLDYPKTKREVWELKDANELLRKAILCSK